MISQLHSHSIAVCTSKDFINIFQVIGNNWIRWIIFDNIFLSNYIAVFLQCASHELQSEIQNAKLRRNQTKLLELTRNRRVCPKYLSLIDEWVRSHSVIFSFDQPAATCGLAKSLPACPNISSSTMNGETGPSISIDFFANSSGVNMIKLDNDRRVLLNGKKQQRNNVRIRCHNSQNHRL